MTGYRYAQLLWDGTNTWKWDEGNSVQVLSAAGTAMDVTYLNNAAAQGWECIGFNSSMPSGNQNPTVLYLFRRPGIV